MSFLAIASAIAAGTLVKTGSSLVNYVVNGMISNAAQQGVEKVVRGTIDAVKDVSGSKK